MKNVFCIRNYKSIICMKKCLHCLVLLFSTILYSCQNQTFQVEGKDAFRLISTTDMAEGKFAFLIECNNQLEIITDDKVREELSKFYNIEGYELHIFSQNKIQEFENNGEKIEENLFEADYRFPPYSYRRFFVKDNDTIAIVKHLDRDLLYTPRKYSQNDTLLLEEAMKYLGLSSCFLCDTPTPTKKYLAHYNDCYAMYNVSPYSYKKWLFIDDNIENDIFDLEENVRVRVSENEKLYVNYYSNKKLTKEQIAKVVMKSKYKDKTIYFYVYDSPQGGYASYIDNAIYMFDCNEIYNIKIGENEWQFISTKKHPKK